MSAQVTLVHALGRDHREDDVHDTLKRVVAQERDAGLEVVGQFAPLKIGGFWSCHTPKTPPMVVPVRNLSHVQECSGQHSSSLKMSGTEAGFKYRHDKAPRHFLGINVDAMCWEKGVIDACISTRHAALFGDIPK